MLSRMTARTLRKQTSSTTTTTSSSTTRIKTPDYRLLSSQKSTAAPVVVSQVFKPWPAETQGVVTCHGDYRQEAWLERYIGGPLYAHQDALPHLPVPTLTDTVQRFLPTATSLATTLHERHELQRKAQVFAHQAAPLQQRLLQRAQEASSNTKSSWLQHWWNHLAYLEYRDSVVINVSYFFHLADDAAAALSTSSSSSSNSSSSTSSNNNNSSSSSSMNGSNPQIRRAAALMTAANQVRRQVCSGTWPAESVGRGDSKKMLCSVAFKYMFHACRIPTTTRDTVNIYDPALHHHVVVACRGHFFQVPLCDPVTGIAYPLPVLEASLQNVLDQSYALEQNSTSAAVPKLGTLTAWNRDDWTVARTALLQAGGESMQQALQTMESAAFVICLDVDVAPVSRAACASWFLHTSTESCSINRWWDKSIQLSICQNGKAGLIGEHSMMDGMPNVGLAHHLTVQTYDKCLLEQQQPANNNNNNNNNNTTGSGTATPIFGPDLYPALMQVQSMVQRSRDDFTKLVNQQSLSVQSFQGYGSDFIKKAGYSPDAFVQMALQIATYRLWNGRQGGTYESTQVRPFLHGRTEVTRSVSEQSTALCHGFGLTPQRNEHDPAERAKKLQLLKDAVTAHIKYIGLAAQGQGVDRHFLGLSLLAQPGEELPELYSDPTFIYSKRWRVSTSHLTHPKFDGWGFGQVYPDGVGVAYSIHARHAIFNITALKEHDQWTEKLSSLLEEALLELRTLVEMDQQDSSPKSKL